MLTQEQIKNLKQGDPLIISGIFRRVDNDGDIWVTIDGSFSYFSPTFVSLPHRSTGLQSRPPSTTPAACSKRATRCVL